MENKHYINSTEENTAERFAAQAGSVTESENIQKIIMTDEKQKAETAKIKAECERARYGFVTMSAQDIQNGEYPEKDYLVEGLITKGLNELAGSIKQGKSLMALNLAIAVAGDTDFWGRATEHGRVLYMALEDNPSRNKKRMNIMLDDRDAPKDLDFTFAVYNTGKTMKNNLQHYIEDYPDTKLIIIDVLQKVRGDKTDNQTEYAHDYKDIGGLKEVADEYGISILVVTHTRKTKDKNNRLNEVTGGVGVTAAADTVLMLDRKSLNNKEGKLFAIGRDIPEVEMEVRLDDDNLRWECIRIIEELDVSNEEKEYNSSPVVSAIKLLLEKNNGEWKGTSRDLLQCGSQELGESISVNESVLGRKLSKFEKFFEKDSIIHIRPNSNGGKSGRIHIFKTDNKDMQNEGETALKDTDMNQREWTDARKEDNIPFEYYENLANTLAVTSYQE